MPRWAPKSPSAATAGGGAGHARSGPRGPREERSGLVANDLEVGRLADVDAGAAAELHDLAVDQAAQRGHELPEELRRGVGRPLERVREQQVAGEDTDRVPPEAARRRLPAPLLPVVDDVVGKERRQVPKLGDDGVLARGRRDLAETRRREENGQRTDTLAPGLEEVLRRVGGRNEPLPRRGAELPLDPDHVGPEERMGVREAAYGALADAVYGRGLAERCDGGSRFERHRFALESSELGAASRKFQIFLKLCGQSKRGSSLSRCDGAPKQKGGQKLRRAGEARP